MAAPPHIIERQRSAREQQRALSPLIGQPSSEVPTCLPLIGCEPGMREREKLFRYSAFSFHASPRETPRIDFIRRRNAGFLYLDILRAPQRLRFRSAQVAPSLPVSAFVGHGTGLYLISLFGLRQDLRRSSLA